MGVARRVGRTAATLALVLSAQACALRGPPSLLEPGKHTRTAPATYRVEMTTSEGPVVIEVRRAWAPLGADRFYNLVRAGFYDGARFFRVVPGFVVQFGLNGDPAVTAAWRQQKFPDDSVRTSNRAGTITFATSGPNSRTTQVFVNLVDNTRLDAMGFAPFGTVISGMDVMKKLHSGYGEGAPMGRGPSQDRIMVEGNAYLLKEFPLLDHVVKAEVK